ncbi:DNA polymerase subunit gamma-2, mitochondrial [Sardina pilchardus]|uniref:DNA polymerase subunit gamma-2, mitochondrial n=1 Tax=Sardina pilchardus TaxID=27697 RepID=UPI002E165A38
MKMFTYCVRRRALQMCLQSSHYCNRCALQLNRAHSTQELESESDLTTTLLKLCEDRSFIAPGEAPTRALRRGNACGYGPLGKDLKKNILDQWWNSITRSKAQVFGIDTLQHVRNDAGSLKLVDASAIGQIINDKDLTKNQVVDRLHQLLQNSSPVRTNLLQGALEQCLPSMELVKRKLPFGLAETGTCHQVLDQNKAAIGCSSELTEASLAWFCSPRTSLQWLDHWTQQRLKWWRKFALSPSDFSSSGVVEAELPDGASRGVQVMYRFPWGSEPLETLWNLGESELLKTHGNDRAKLQCKDGRKLVVPHVVAVNGNMDRGLLAYLFNSLQLEKKKVSGKQRLHQRKVLKLHPTLAPIKVALDMGRGATVERRQVCEGLLTEFLDADISVWPGYLETMPQSLEQLHSKYDEMGVLFTVMISEGTLENGLLLVRSRDTTITETMHISEVKAYLQKYISAADNI